jgi:hypothetical protein
MSIPLNRAAFTCPCRLMDRNSGPALMPACSNHACIVRTGHVSGLDPQGMPILRPLSAPSSAATGCGPRFSRTCVCFPRATISGALSRKRKRKHCWQRAGGPIPVAAPCLHSRRKYLYAVLRDSALTVEANRLHFPRDHSGEKQVRCRYGPCHSCERACVGRSGVLGQSSDQPQPRNGQPYFNTSLFSPNALGAQSNASRRSFYGPGIHNYDVALHKVTKFAESRTLEIRFELFNAFNHGQFFGAGAVNGNIDSATFGYVTQAAPPRIAQVAPKFTF